MNRFNGLFTSHFAGCQQVGYLENDNVGTQLKIYKLPDQEELVGVADGFSCWVANPKYSLFGMKKFERQSTPRRKLNVNC